MSTSKLRVLHGTENVAGIVSNRSNSLKKIGITSVCVDYGFIQQKYGYECDYLFLDPIKLTDFFLKSLKKYDLFHFYYYTSFDRRGKFEDLKLLKMLNKKIVMEFVGSELRTDELLEEERRIGIRKYTFFHYESGIYRKDFQEKKERLISILPYLDGILAYPCIAGILKGLNINYGTVSFPYSLSRVDNIKDQRTKQEKEIIQILHIATSPSIKGTDIIQKAAVRLEKEYPNCKFNFIIKFQMSNRETLQRIANSDIVIDSIIHGVPGQLTMEALALGKPVAVHYNPNLIFYPNLPIQETNPDNIFDSLSELIKSKELRTDLGTKGRNFIEQQLNLTKCGLELLNYYNSISTVKCTGNIFSRIASLWKLLNHNWKYGCVNFQYIWFPEYELNQIPSVRKGLFLCCQNVKLLTDKINNISKNIAPIDLIITKNKISDFNFYKNKYILNSNTFSSSNSFLNSAPILKEYDFIVIPTCGDIFYYINVFDFAINCGIPYIMIAEADNNYFFNIKSFVKLVKTMKHFKLYSAYKYLIIGLKNILSIL